MQTRSGLPDAPANQIWPASILMTAPAKTQANGPEFSAQTPPCDAGLKGRELILPVRLVPGLRARPVTEKTGSADCPNLKCLRHCCAILMPSAPPVCAALRNLGCFALTHSCPGPPMRHARFRLSRNDPGNTRPDLRWLWPHGQASPGLRPAQIARPVLIHLHRQLATKQPQSSQTGATLTPTYPYKCGFRPWLPDGSPHLCWLARQVARISTAHRCCNLSHAHRSTWPFARPVHRH